MAGEPTSRWIKIFRFHEHGGPEVLRLEEMTLDPPGPGQILVRQTAIGVNFRDIYRRNGQFPVDRLPAGLGNESVGIVEAVGQGVGEIKVGQRVAIAGGPDNAYAEARIAPEATVIALPDEIDDDTAAGMMVRGMTARYLVKKICPLGPGDTVLVHAAAGGVGLILCQWANALGATVIGTVGSDEKAALAAENGCAYPIVYTRADFVARVREITEGRGVRAVYDSVGKDTFEGSLKCLAPLGVLANFGEASGDAPPIAPRQLGTVFLIHPSLVNFVRPRTAFLEGATDVLDAVTSGMVRIRIGARYPLEDAATAMADLAARRTTGSVILKP